MENLDIIILSSIVTVLFVVFLFFVFRELSRPESDFVITEDNGPRTKFIKKVGTIFDNPPESPKPKNKSRQVDRFIKSVE